MAYKKTRDILDRAKLFHQHLSELYERLESVATREQVRMLLDYMSRHERHLTRCLEEYEEEASGRILDYWFKFTPNNKACEQLENIELTPEMTIEELLALSIRLDDCLIALYRSVAESSKSEEVRDVFTSLLEMEKQEEVELLRNALDLK